MLCLGSNLFAIYWLERQAGKRRFYVKTVHALQPNVPLYVPENPVGRHQPITDRVVPMTTGFSHSHWLILAHEDFGLAGMDVKVLLVVRRRHVGTA